MYCTHRVAVKVSVLTLVLALNAVLPLSKTPLKFVVLASNAALPPLKNAILAGTCPKLTP